MVRPDLPHTMLAGQSCEASASFLKKRSKKLLIPLAAASPATASPDSIAPPAPVAMPKKRGTEMT
jgi:hypothetical protein